MKSCSPLLFLLLLVLACRREEKSQLIFAGENDRYRIEIATIETKINAQGIAQCSKYMRSTVNDSLYQSYGMSLPMVLAYSLHTTEKYLKGADLEQLKRKYLKIRIDNHTDSQLDYDAILMESFSKHFRLNVSPYQQEVEGLRLQVIDSLKLKSVQASCGTAKVRYDQGKFKASAISLQGIAKIADQNIGNFVYLSSDDSHCYTLDFLVSEDRDQMNHHLAPYGLHFEKEKYLQTFYQVDIPASSRLTRTSSTSSSSRD